MPKNFPSHGTTWNKNTTALQPYKLDKNGHTIHLLS